MYERETGTNARIDHQVFCQVFDNKPFTVINLYILPMPSMRIVSSNYWCPFCFIDANIEHLAMLTQSMSDGIILAALRHNVIIKRNTEVIIKRFTAIYGSVIGLRVSFKRPFIVELLHFSLVFFHSFVASTLLSSVGYHLVAVAVVVAHFSF